MSSHPSPSIAVKHRIAVRFCAFLTTLTLITFVTCFNTTVDAAQAPPPLPIPASDAPAISATHRLPIAHSPFSDPVDAILLPAEIPDKNWNRGHRGVDLKAYLGDAVLASRGGTIYFAGVVAGTPTISVLHSDGLRTTYQPVTATVEKGQAVRRGEQIGTLADASLLGPHAQRAPGLSWGAKVDERYIDPMTLLGTPHVRLYLDEQNSMEG